MKTIRLILISCVLGVLSPCLPGKESAACGAESSVGVPATDSDEGHGREDLKPKDADDQKGFPPDDFDVSRFAENGEDSLDDYIRRAETYAPTGKEPDWRGAIERLSSKVSAQRSKASDFLVDLLKQAYDDEFSDRARWYPSPFASHPEPTCPAREIRERIVETLAEQGRTPAAVPVLRWFLKEEHVWYFQSKAARALCGLRGPKADALLLELVAASPENGDVTMVVLNAVRERGLKVSPAILALLCQHHRKHIRDKARHINDQLGHPKPSPFDPVQAVRGASIQQWMDKLGEELNVAIEPETPYVEVSFFVSRDKEVWTFKRRGWLLNKTPKEYFLLNLRGGCRTTEEKSNLLMPTVVSH